MTTQLQPGDLVLREGRVEEVSATYPGTERMYSVGVAGVYHLFSNATRIGNIRDGWRIHTGSERPADVGASDNVQLMFSDRQRYDGPGGNFVWFPVCGIRIVAYRVVSRAQPEDKTISALREIAASGGEQNIMSDREAELRAVAAEIERHVSGKSAVWAERAQRWAAIIRNDPPKPEPLKLGDRVRHQSAGDGLIKHIEGQHAMVLYDDKGSSTYVVWHIGNLERIP